MARPRQDATPLGEDALPSMDQIMAETNWATRLEMARTRREALLAERRVVARIGGVETPLPAPIEDRGRGPSMNERMTLAEARREQLLAARKWHGATSVGRGPGEETAVRRDKVLPPLMQAEDLAPADAGAARPRRRGLVLVAAAALAGLAAAAFWQARAGAPESAAPDVAASAPQGPQAGDDEAMAAPPDAAAGLVPGDPLAAGATFLVAPLDLADASARPDNMAPLTPGPVFLAAPAGLPALMAGSATHADDEAPSVAMAAILAPAAQPAMPASPDLAGPGPDLRPVVASVSPLPADQGLTGLRVVLHAPQDVSAGTLVAMTDSLRRAGILPEETRRTGLRISRNNVRYYDRADAPAAAAIAGAIGGEALDFSAFRPLPPKGTVEIWLESGS